MPMLTSAVLVATMLGLALAAPHVTRELVDSINRVDGLSWKASTHQGTLIEGATTAQLKGLCGVKKNHHVKLPKRVFTEKERALAVPDSFDAAEQWPHCPSITHIRDQSECGSCWAVAAAEGISDRYCTLGNISNYEISAANIMECCWLCGSGCQGGDPSMAWQNWVWTGYTSDACQPYPFPKCEHHIPVNHYPACPSTVYPTPSCSTSCTGNTTSNYTLFKGATAYTLSGESDFQRELLTRGPFEVAFTVYGDFPTYKSGVYVQTNNTELGGHAVRVVGWGSLNGVPYWKIANSWNTDWGLSGYFLIKRGVDECGIEDSGAAGTP